MPFRTVLYTCVLLLTLGLAAQAASVPQLLSHQGRLIDSDDAPVTGMRALTFNLFEAPTGGVALWTELHPAVSINEGLFTVLLGSTVPMTADLFSPPSSGSPVERWLEVSVDGQVLLPRMRIASVAYAASSSRMDGDVETSPGELRLHGMSGSTTGTIRMTASDGGNEDSTQLYLYARKNGAITTADYDYKATSSRSSLTLGMDEDGDAHRENQLTATATLTDGSSMSVTSDGDDDGFPEGEALMKSKGSSGGIRLGGMSGSTTGTIRMAAAPESTYQESSALDTQGFGGHSRGMNSNVRSTTLLGVDRDLKSTSIEQDCDESSARGILSGMSGSTTGTIRMMAGPDSVVDYMDMDSDDDGVAEAVTKKYVDADAAHSVYMGRSGSTTGTIRMMASPDSTLDYRDVDDDGDGFSEMQARLKLGVANGGLEISSDRISSGPRQTVSMDGSYSHAQSRCISDFDRDGIQDVVVAARSDSSGGGNYLDMDSDDDGFGDCSVRSTVTDDSATFRLTRLPPGTPYIGNFSVTTSGPITKGALSGMSGSTTGTIRMMATPDSAADYLDMDSDNDGISESSTKQYVDGSLAHSSLAGRSGSTTATIRMSSSGGGGGGGSLSPMSEFVMDADSDGDGVADHDITADCDDQDARIRVTNIGSSGQDGVSIEASSSSRRVRLGNLGSSGQDGVDMEVGSSLRRLTVGNIGSSGQDGVSIEVDGTSRRLTVGNIGSSGQDGVSMEVDASTSRLKIHNLGSSGQDGVSFEATSTGAHMGLDTIPGTAKIAVGGGAYCDGTDWVNASDVNSKENFESVDGAEVLDRLADLKISRWNYKSQPGVEHIGPTAQDFQKAFGVGVNDKSISTIDPSGIALAAIQELQKQNADLRGENADLREALEALSRKVDALVATQ